MSFREFLNKLAATLTFLAGWAAIMTALYALFFHAFHGTWPRWS